jgi:hypothetical protein
VLAFRMLIVKKSMNQELDAVVPPIARRVYGSLKTVAKRKTRMKVFCRNNGLSLTLLSCFFLFWVGQAAMGYLEHVDEARSHNVAPHSFIGYLSSSHFWEATFENWESEFLQMAAYVLLTVFLYQRGSAESKDPDDPEDSKHAVTSKSPKIVQRGGWGLKVYEHSLSLSLCGLFLLCFAGHAIAGHAHHNHELLEHGFAQISLAEYFWGPQFWFESLQNWQSEFLAVATIVVLSIWLREKGSPESKPVQAAHKKTGG